MPPLRNRPQVPQEIAPLIRRTEDYLTLCLSRGARGRFTPAAPGKRQSTEEVFAQFLSSRTRGGQSNVALPRVGSTLQRIQTMTQTRTSDINRMGKLATLNLDDKESLATRLLSADSAALFSDLRPSVTQALKDRLKEESDRLPANPTVDQIRARMMSRFAGFNQPLGQAFTGGLGQARPPTAAQALKLNIIKVRASDLVDEFFVDWGTDVIRMGGLASCTATGERFEVKQFPVGEFSTDHPKKTFGGDGKDFAVFSLTGPVWPRVYIATIALAEKDVDGGFIDFLIKLWDTIDEVVIQTLTGMILTALAAGTAAAGVGAAAGAGAGAAATAPTGPGAIGGAAAGALIGAITGLIVAGVFSLVTEALKDDFFEPAVVIPWMLTGPSDRFDGELTSPLYDIELSRSDASYVVSYNWSLVL